MDFETFDEFEQLLYKLSEQGKADKKSAQLISPATYITGEDITRKNVNVLEWAGWAALDVDKHDFGDDLKKELHEKFGEYYYVCYSTASSRVDNPKFRLVFKLESSVPADKLRHFWFALNELSGENGDVQVKDFSRMYYIPGRYAKAFNFIFTNKGKGMDPYDIMDKCPYVEKTNNPFFDNLPEELQNEIIEHRKNALDNTTYKWTGYQDCPFWPKKLAIEYQVISEGGWYYQLYKIMVAIAGNAIKKKYPITVGEITELCREFDAVNGGWYKDRPIETEANRALEYCYRNIS